MPMKMYATFFGLRWFSEIVFFTAPNKTTRHFQQGGFVSCPLVWAAWLYRIPAIIHESDLTPGLANRLSRQPFAAHVCYSFSRAPPCSVRKSHLYRYPDPAHRCERENCQRSRTVRIYGCETGRGDSWRKPGIGK